MACTWPGLTHTSMASSQAIRDAGDAASLAPATAAAHVTLEPRARSARGSAEGFGHVPVAACEYDPDGPTGRNRLETPPSTGPPNRTVSSNETNQRREIPTPARAPRSKARLSKCKPAKRDRTRADFLPSDMFHLTCFTRTSTISAPRLHAAAARDPNPAARRFSRQRRPSSSPTRRCRF